MNDEQMWGRSSEEPPEQSDAGGVPTVSLESSAEVRRRGIGARAVAAVLGVVLLLGGVGFAAAQLGADDRTPEEAVGEFFQALSDEDVLGVLATLDPGERDALAQPVQDLFDELERLEVLDGSFDPSAVGGVDLNFDGMTYEQEPVRDDLARVRILGGQVSYTVDGASLPLGDFVRDTLDRFGVDLSDASGSDSSTIDAGSEDFLAVRRGPDGWRVSIAYTVAEAARLDAGAPVPDPAAALTPIGADSPEAAVDGVVRAMAALDLPGVVARFSPDELRALQEYWPLVGADALPDASELGMQVDVRSLDLRSETDGDRARVYVDGFDVGMTVDGSHLDLTYADGCVTYEGDLDRLGLDPSKAGEPVCPDDMDSFFQDSMGTSGLDGLGIDPPSFGPVRTPDGYVVADKVDGTWYVAPVNTVANGMVELLRAIDRSHLDAVVDMVDGFFTSFENAMTFDGQGTPLLDPNAYDDTTTFVPESVPTTTTG